MLVDHSSQSIRSVKHIGVGVQVFVLTGSAWLCFTAGDTHALDGSNGKVRANIPCSQGTFTHS